MRSTAALLLTLVALGMLAGCGGSDEEGPERFGDFFGVVPVETPTEVDFARMAAGGIGSYHLQLQWSTIEHSKGTYDWNAYDEVMRQLARSGIQPIPYVVGTPGVYADDPTIPPTDDEETFDAWADFLSEAALRYGPDGEFWDLMATTDPDVEPVPLHSWEIWNEPNSSVFWKPAPDPAAYADLLKRSARVIEKVDPEAEIMTAGMFATPQSDGAIKSYDFLRDILGRNGVTDIVDLVGVHPYGPRVQDVVTQVEGTREAVDEAGNDAGLWVTELGWGSDPSSGNQLAKTPEEQAQLLSESFNELYDRRDEWGLRGVVWFTWRDTPGPVGDCVWCQTAGLVDPDRDSKPAWLAFTELTGGEP